MFFPDENLKFFDNYSLAYEQRKDIWISRYRDNDFPKASEIIKVKIIVEWNGNCCFLVKFIPHVWLQWYEILFILS
jgi:hypothetical protein